MLFEGSAKEIVYSVLEGYSGFLFLFGLYIYIYIYEYNLKIRNYNGIWINWSREDIYNDRFIG